MARNQPQPAAPIFQTPKLSPGELGALRRIDGLGRELRHYVASSPKRWFGLVRRVLSARAIQGSNSIEGYNVSVEDAVAAVEGGEPTDASSENWRAISGYRRAMTYVLQLAEDPHFLYTPQLLRSLHFMMTEDSTEASPGLWRPGPVWVRNDATGEIVYEGADSGAVPALVNELVSDLDAPSTTPPLIRAAMAHLNLVMIHPFRDGNGRMSRCLQTLVLAREGILAPELSSIEEYLGRNTSAYYAVLAEVGKGRWNPAQDATPWVRFCLQAHFVQASSVLRRIRESESLWIALGTLLEEHHLPHRAIAAAFDAALGLRVRNASYRLAVKNSYDLEISQQVASDDFRAMVRAGVLTAHGSKRGAYYTAGSDVARLHAESRARRANIDASELFATASGEAGQMDLLTSR